MSHEVLLIAGADEASARDRRQRVIQHAAELVPGRAASRFVDTRIASIAVVNTSPAGGTAVTVAKERDSALVAVAINPNGLVAAAEDPSKGCTFGSEAGHVAIRVTSDHFVIISTDGMASVPGYWGNHEGNLVFATHLASLVSLGAPTEVDSVGLSEYLAMLHPQQDRTLLDGAKLLPPGGRLTWHDGSVDLRAEPIFVPRDHAMTDDEAIDTYRNLWHEILDDTFARHTDRRVTVGLSGGLDSRAIVAGAAAQGKRPMTFSYGDDRNIETRTARAVASRLGNPHVVLPVTDDYLMPEPENIVARLDGAHSPAEIYEGWFTPVISSFSDVLINGSGGGQLWGDEKTLGLTDSDHVQAKVWARYSNMAGSVRPYLEATAGTDLEHEVRIGIGKSLAEWDISERADMTAFWRMANRQVRWGTMLVNATRRAGLCLETPFLDSRCIGFSASLSAEQRLNGRLHLRAHREVFPSTSSIPRSDDGNSPRNLSHVYWSGETSYLKQLATLSRRHPVSAGRRALRRIGDVGTSVLRDWTSYAAPANWWDQRSTVFAIELWSRMRQPFADRLANVIEAPGHVHAVFDETALAAAALALRAGRFTGSGAAIARVAAANAWLVDYSQRARGYRRLFS